MSLVLQPSAYREAVSAHGRMGRSRGGLSVGARHSSVYVLPEPDRIRLGLQSISSLFGDPRGYEQEVSLSLSNAISDIVRRYGARV